MGALLFLIVPTQSVGTMNSGLNPWQPGRTAAHSSSYLDLGSRRQLVTKFEYPPLPNCTKKPRHSVSAKITPRAAITRLRVTRPWAAMSKPVSATTQCLDTGRGPARPYLIEHSDQPTVRRRDRVRQRQGLAMGIVDGRRGGRHESSLPSLHRRLLSQVSHWVASAQALPRRIPR